MIKQTKKDNPVAKTLSDSRFKKQVVKSRKGKGSYSRKCLEKFFRVSLREMTESDYNSLKYKWILKCL